ncbi:MAG TPA: YheV family putative metal-binding protein [Alcanivoracaceae bacterium]|nr:YheV family putative metal-binding protein [Alcanivoracaceae bacterium]
MSVKRQFIAGARCPECGVMDKVRRCQTEDETWMECLGCGMKRMMDDEPAEVSAEPEAVEQAVIWRKL